MLIMITCDGIFNNSNLYRILRSLVWISERYREGEICSNDIHSMLHVYWLSDCILIMLYSRLEIVWHLDRNDMWSSKELIIII